MADVEVEELDRHYVELLELMEVLREGGLSGVAVAIEQRAQRVHEREGSRRKRERAMLKLVNECVQIESLLIWSREEGIS